MTNNDARHYIVTRIEHGWTSGPGTGVSYPDERQVMAASRTLAGAKRAQRRLGGTIAVIRQPYRRYQANEAL